MTSSTRATSVHERRVRDAYKRHPIVAGVDGSAAKVFADGAVDEKTKQLIAVSVAHVTRCPYCIQGHTKAALRKGADEHELMEAIWVAAEMRAGGA